MTEDDAAEMDVALAQLPCPALPAALADRVGRLTRAHLAPPPQQPAPALRSRLREALVPALLMSAALVRTADTVTTARRLFSDDNPTTTEPDADPATGDDRP